MLKCYTVKAPAKINIYLHVMPKRSDGYHAIESIFQKIPLFDELIVQEITELNACCVECEQMQLPKKNTLTSIYDEFVKVTGLQNGVKVKLNKRIPSGAGLGGGSSDAASLLYALNDMFNANLDKKTMHAIATKVGSDVPFFLGSDCALVTGRGELIEEIPARRDLFFVLVTPEVHSSTKEAYDNVDEWLSRKKEKNVIRLEDVKDMYFDDVQKWTFFNTFTMPQREHFPEIERVLAAVKTTKTSFFDMSGSGSSVFGVYLSEKDAQDAYGFLSQKWKHCWMLASRSACSTSIR
ncbi:MAG: 4-(cytidine 5'-diphospho)-2-C-methyl-D-erythritol kinase [Treponema sp. CETP13]|nr:MAG: 4-(cytidine 5'-diphospho)-2-C-methyl-D-erythritol kinase [Treponema sp. CETP13]